MQEFNSVSDRRWAVRREIRLDAYLAASDRPPEGIIVVDMTEDGCGALVGAGVDLALGGLETIVLKGFEPLTASVIWSKEGQAGFAFVEPLQQGLLERVMTKSLHDMIGRRLSGERQRDQLIGHSSGVFGV